MDKDRMSKLPSRYRPGERFNQDRFLEPPRVDVPMYAIGFVDPDGTSVGMTDGPTEDVQNMLDVFPDSDSRPCFIFEFWMRELPIYRWHSRRQEWIKCSSP